MDPEIVKTGTEASSTVRKKTVLVVEDEEAIREFLTDLLDTGGYRVITAVNGLDGIQHTFSDGPDVVLTDIMMPEMDGLSFLRRVRTEIPAKALPIIVVSALATEDKVVEAFDLGATDYLVKPFRAFELLARIKVALKQRLDPALVNLVPRELKAGPSRTDFRSGSLFDMGKYEILSEIGEGGMGSVFLARHRTYDTHVAVKVLDPDLTEDRNSVVRFLREVRIAAGLDHPNIVKVYDVGLTGKAHYYAMEKLPADSLADKVDDGGPIEETHALDLGIQLSSALAYMHSRGFLHRDVKPSNILFVDDWKVKLIDFGLARSLDDGRLTREGSFVGTPGFVAPESISSYDAPGPGSDIYALGSTLYAVIVGKCAFDEKRSATSRLRAQVLEPAPAAHLRNPDISKDLSEIVRKMMAPDPGERFPSMQAVHDALTFLRHGG
ncbi:MAG: protein kinase domain-containing protein [Planctomycetota bacterium]